MSMEIKTANVQVFIKSCFHNLEINASIWQLQNSDSAFVSTGGLFCISSPKLVCLAGTDKHRKQSSAIAASAKISLCVCVLSWESKTNSSGGLYQWEVSSSRHEAHNGLGLKVNLNLIMSNPPPGSTSWICSSFTPCNVCDQRMNSELWNNWNLGAAPLSLFLILCLPFFFLLSPDCLPSSPLPAPPQLWAPPMLKRHISWCHY